MEEAHTCLWSFCPPLVGMVEAESIMTRGHRAHLLVGENKEGKVGQKALLQSCTPVAYSNRPLFPLLGGSS